MPSTSGTLATRANQPDIKLKIGRNVQIGSTSQFTAILRGDEENEPYFRASNFALNMYLNTILGGNLSSVVKNGWISLNNLLA
jgi:hypothetical protein